MKLRALKLPTFLLTCLAAAFWAGSFPALAGDTPTSPGEQTPPPLGQETASNPVSTSAPAASSPAPSASPAAKRGGKRNEPAGGTPKPARVKQVKAIPFPLPIHETSGNAKIPELGMTGELLSQLMAAKLTRVDNEHVEMHEAKIDLYHPDGKEDFHVAMPDSILNLQTHIISSNHPVTVRTQDFELTGERMQFNTVDRTGELQGNVHMVIHNLKQVAGTTSPTAAP